MPLKPRPKPEPDDDTHPAVDPWNALLDEFEAQVRLLLDNGLEPQLRTRLDRLLPVGSAEAQGRGLYRGLLIASPESVGPEIEVAPPTPPDRMTMARVLSTCQRLSRQRLVAGEHEALAELRGWIMAHLPPIKRAAA